VNLKLRIHLLPISLCSVPSGLVKSIIAPKGTLDRYEAYPGLAPWAKTNAAAARLACSSSWFFVERTFASRVLKNAAAAGLRSIFHFTQHYACGSVLGYPDSPRWG